MDQCEQAQATWNYGEHLATRTTVMYKILLWQIEDFYIEMFYDYINNKIEKLRSFRNPDLLTPYLNQIDITSIFE